MNAKLELEVLEDRCVPSTLTTTIPNPLSVNPAIIQRDIDKLFAPRVDAPVVFLGDSINDLYGTMPEWGVWGSNAANYAVGGQTTQGLLLQLWCGQLAGTSPLVVVLNMGGNNLLQGNSPQDTAEGIVADINMIGWFAPHAQVVVEGIQPGGVAPDNPYRLAGTQTNQLVQQMVSENNHITFANIGGIFLQPNGFLNTGLFYYDYIHPNALGYLGYTEALEPVVFDAAWTAAARDGLI